MHRVRVGRTSPIDHILPQGCAQARGFAYMGPRPPPSVYELICLPSTGSEMRTSTTGCRTVAYWTACLCVGRLASSVSSWWRRWCFSLVLARLVLFGHSGPRARHSPWQPGINNASAAGWATVSSIICRLSSSVPFRQSSAGKTKVRREGGWRRKILGVRGLKYKRKWRDFFQVF